MATRSHKSLRLVGLVWQLPDATRAAWRKPRRLRTYREVLAKFGDLDVLVNNAGVGIFKNLVDFARTSFDTVFATNVVGAMLMAREAAKHFIGKNRGNIVNIGSTYSGDVNGPFRRCE